MCYLLYFSSGVDERFGVSGNSSFLFESRRPMFAKRLSNVAERILNEMGSMDFTFVVLLVFVLESPCSCWCVCCCDGLLGFWLLICSWRISSSSVNAFVGTIFFWLLLLEFLRRLRNFLVGDLLRALLRRLSSLRRKFFSWKVAGWGADNLCLVFFSIKASARRDSLSTVPSLCCFIFNNYKKKEWVGVFNSKRQINSKIYIATEQGNEATVHLVGGLKLKKLEVFDHFIVLYVFGSEWNNRWTYSIFLLLWKGLNKGFNWG